MKKYKLILNEEQVESLMWALNFYSRMKCGQLTELKNLTEFKPTEDTLTELHRQMFPSLKGFLNSNFGIASGEAPEEAKVCYDIYKKIHFIWNPVGVYSYKPSSISKQGLPDFEVVE